MNFPSTSLIFSLKSHVFKYLHSVSVSSSPSPSSSSYYLVLWIIEGIKYSTLIQGHLHLSSPSPHLVNTATLTPYPSSIPSRILSSFFAVLEIQKGPRQPPVFAFQELPAWWRHSFKSGHFQCTWAGLEFRLKGTKSRVEGLT